jgi:hypothetical protein
MRIRLLPALLLAMCLISSAAFAQSLKWNEDLLTITPAATCSDGSPANDCPVATWRIERASSPTATTWTLVTSLAGNTLTYKPTGLPAGQNCYRVAAIGVSGQQSGWSTVASAQCQTATPPAPGTPSLSVTDVVAYEIRPNSTGTLVASRVGLVPEGSLCGQDSREVNGVTYHRVDPRSVDLINWPASTANPLETFARCG